MFAPLQSPPDRVKIASLFLALAATVPAQLHGQVVEPRKSVQPDIGTISSMKHDIQPFGKTNDGQEVKVHTLTNLNGVRVRLIDYGATLISVETPDNGKMANITLGFQRSMATCSGIRISARPSAAMATASPAGKFTLDGKEYTLATNNGPNHLHGGARALTPCIWKAEPVTARRLRSA